MKLHCFDRHYYSLQDFLCKARSMSTIGLSRSAVDSADKNASSDNKLQGLFHTLVLSQGPYSPGTSEEGSVRQGSKLTSPWANQLDWKPIVCLQAGPQSPALEIWQDLQWWMKSCQPLTPQKLSRYSLHSEGSEQ